MKLIEFNIKNGVYHFELDHIETTLHSHPAIEIIIAKRGTFSLLSKTNTFNKCKVAIIDQNVLHQVKTENTLIELLMFEFRRLHLFDIFSQYNIEFKEGVYITTSTSTTKGLLDILHKKKVEGIEAKSLEQRVNICLQYFDQPEIDYLKMIPELKLLTFLSESRLSHLFKANTGLSLKKYLVWARLKKVIHKVLLEKKSLHTAAIECGFFDQAHFSRAFKTYLGIPPVKAYNSRTVQE